MNEYELLHTLGEHGVRPTANRLLIVRQMSAAGRPMSMTELEEALETVDKSIISRTLALLRDHHLVHAIEDGAGIRYELCHSHDDEDDGDLHAHFYCERCGKTFCLENIPVKAVTLPQGYQVRTVNYLLKGICPECARRQRA